MTSVKEIAESIIKERDDLLLKAIVESKLPYIRVKYMIEKVNQMLINESLKSLNKRAITGRSRISDLYESVMCMDYACGWLKSWYRKHNKRLGND